MATHSWRHWIRRIVTVVVVAALFLPVVRNRDGLPLSTYPMYAGARSNEISFVTAVGRLANGEMAPLPMQVIADTHSPLIVQTYLNSALARGDAAIVCHLIANRAPEIDAIEIATERHNTINRIRGEASLLDRQIHASCSAEP